MIAVLAFETGIAPRELERDPATLEALIRIREDHRRKQERGQLKDRLRRALGR